MLRMIASKLGWQWRTIVGDGVASFFFSIAAFSCLLVLVFPLQALRPPFPPDPVSLFKTLSDFFSLGALHEKPFAKVLLFFPAAVDNAPSRQ